MRVRARPSVRQSINLPGLFPSRNLPEPRLAINLLKLRSAIRFPVVLLAIVSSILISSCSSPVPADKSGDGVTAAVAPLRMAISPYQDTCFLVNAKPLGLEKNYGTQLELITLPWEEILTSLASAGPTVDVGYVSLTDFLTKEANINKQTDDPVVFIYPLYVFKGGGFVTFNSQVPELNQKTINDPATVKKFLSYKIGAPKNSMMQMLLFMLAKKAGIKFSDIHFTDIMYHDGLLAAENGSLDIAAAGVTQRTEAEKRHGRVVLTMDTLETGDIDGLACKQSTYERRKKDIEALIRMQFDCQQYVLTDLDHHSETILAYLKERASTQYTLPEFKKALTHQYFPSGIEEVQKEILSDEGKYSIDKASAMIDEYLKQAGIARSAHPTVKVISISGAP